MKFRFNKSNKAIKKFQKNKKICSLQLKKQNKLNFILKNSEIIKNENDIYLFIIFIYINKI